MIGIILAAGIGSRLRPMTNTKPKCLVTTAGKPILQYQLDAYLKAGITELIIVIGYEGNTVRDYCKHIKGMDITIVENTDYENTNNMYSLYLTRKLTQGRAFILNNADLSIDDSIVAALMESTPENAIAVDSSLFNEESMKISIDQNGVVTNISKEISESRSHACSIDFYKFSANASDTFFAKMQQIIEGEKNLKDWTEVAMQQLFQAGELRFEPCDIAGKPWVEIDNYEDLALSDRIFSRLDQILPDIENVLFDLDGTIYVGSEPLEGAADAVRRLEQQGKNIFFLSNNSSKAKFDYVELLGTLGIDVRPEQIVLSTDGLIAFLRSQKVNAVHVLGTNSMKKVLMDEGFRIDSASPEYVVLGYDTELDYAKLVTACKHINDGVDLLATHGDNFCPSEYGPIPDIGALIAMIKVTTGKAPKYIFGKPDLGMVEPLITEHKLDVRKTLIVGDRLHTDIQLSKLIDCYGMLVLSGETTRDQLESSRIQPDFVLNAISHV